MLENAKFWCRNSIRVDAIRSGATYVCEMKQIALTFALILSSSPVLAQDTEQQPLALSEISDYLNDLTTAKGSFTQINDDGSQTSGTLYLKRPGRMRLEYDPPVEAVVVAGGGAVVIFDPKSNQPAETYPLKRTPLSIILKKNVDLDEANMVVGHAFDGIATVVTAQDPKNPEYGQIDLIFDHDPVRLNRWVIHDGTGAQITLVLGELETGIRLKAELFSTQIVGEQPDR